MFFASNFADTSLVKLEFHLFLIAAIDFFFYQFSSNFFDTVILRGIYLSRYTITFLSTKYAICVC